MAQRKEDAASAAARLAHFEAWVAETIAAGCEMEGSQFGAASSIREKSKEAYGDTLLSARMTLVGLIARLLAQRSGQPGVVREDLSHRLTLVAAFLQGIGVTEDLISEGQYIKAAAALKQDLEIITALEETAQGLARKGKRPLVEKRLRGGKRPYRKLNDVAHPSNVDILERLMLRKVVTADAAGVTPLPIFVAQTAVELYEIHVWTLLSMVREITLLMRELYGGELQMPEDAYIGRSWRLVGEALEEAGHVTRDDEPEA